MSQFTIGAQQLVRDLLEMDDDDIDVKALDEPSPDGYWIQIGGDANPWIWGGTWFNPAKRQLLHFGGIDQEGGDVDYHDVEVPPEMLAKLPPEQPDWQDNVERDRIIDNYKIAKAELMTNQMKRPFYLMGHIPMDQLPSHWRRYENECPTGIDQEVWQEMPIEAKMDELASYFGWGDYGEEFKMSYYQAKKFLKLNL